MKQEGAAGGGPVCDVLRRLTDLFYLVRCRAHLRADGGFEDCKRNAFSFIEVSRKQQQQSVVAVLTPPSIAEVLAAFTLPLAACCYWLPLNVRVAT